VLNELVMKFAETERRLSPTETCTIGRAADIIIDESNQMLHRVLAELAFRDRRWMIANIGRTISLVITDLDGASFARLAPGATVAVPFANTSVSFSAGRANYQLTLHQAPVDDHDVAMPPPGYQSAVVTRTPTTLAFNDEQFELLVALAGPRIDGPITAADLPSNRQLAAQLGWTPAKLVRKLDHLCAKLARAGVSGLVGSTTSSATDRRVRLADVAVEQGLVDRSHLLE